MKFSTLDYQQNPQFSNKNANALAHAKRALYVKAKDKLNYECYIVLGVYNIIRTSRSTL